MNIINDLGAEELRNAVILQAVTDYRYALCKIHGLELKREKVEKNNRYSVMNKLRKLKQIKGNLVLWEARAQECGRIV